jgi:hypothetical protein
MTLAAYMTLSRGGAVEIAVALIVFIVLHPRRLALLPTLLNVAIGSLTLVFLASHREDLANGLATATAASQANQMIVAVVAVAIVVGLVEAAIATVGRRSIGPRPSISRATSRSVLGGAAIAIVVAGLAVNAPDRLSNAWNTFKAPTGPSEGDTIQRFSSASGNGRYQYWTVAVNSGENVPLTGVGPGTWEFQWSRDGTLPGFVRDAHSLYLEAFAELGIIGFLLISSLIGAVIVVVVRRTLRAPPATRVALAGAAAACASLATAAALDWSWELPVIPVAAMLVIGATATCERSPLATTAVTSQRRLGLAATAIVGALAVALPLPGAILIRSSQDSFNDGDLTEAIDQAKAAEDWQPWAAAPMIQKALVLEQDGQLQAAQAAAVDGTNREPANWRNWYVLAGLDSHLGLVEQATQATEIARSLNPRSPLFASSASSEPQ